METSVNFLEFLRNLEALVINKVEFDGEVNENTLSFIKVPSCLECLKTIKIKRVKGYPKELVKFVLKHAKVLQTIIMHISYPEEDSWDFRKMKNDHKALNKKIMMQLRTSPWASPGCAIKFIFQRRFHFGSINDGNLFD
ncbi:uncharacterized protein LOC113322016 [Papaver somniferum]|uniref:uncharacterized protein LOC113322016 n=1 Tax=Papaver somniferum TaxID=3469 RepID=UPI000E6F8783|nr:uncharacterized protein LOC113322016 [Papaver somniferum]